MQWANWTAIRERLFCFYGLVMGAFKVFTYKRVDSGIAGIDSFDECVDDVDRRKFALADFPD